LLLLLLCLVRYGFTLVYHRVLTTHEAVHCENVREMFRDGDWLIPTYGGRVWLERPPLPHWATGAVASLVGGVDRDWAMRVASILAGAAAVLLTARMASVWYGRGVGLLSGAVLATMREFANYSTGPEADIFLCTMVALGHALLARLEFEERPVEGPVRARFLGGRSWTMLAFFVTLGLTNMTKGPAFGMTFVLLPMAVYFLWNADWQGVRRYVWLWGWLAFAAAAGVWYAAAFWRYPDLIDLWYKTFEVRINARFDAEPFWYYLAHQPWNAFPWVATALIGLAWTARPAFREGDRPARYLWCWALAPLVFFSLSRGKHHHYLLSCLAPLAVLAALGAVRLWDWLRQAPSWLRQPWLGTLAAGALGDAALAAVEAHVHGPAWLTVALLAGWPALVFLGWYAAGRRDGRVAAAGVVALVAAVQCLAYVHQTEFLDRYKQDSVFLREAASLTPAGQPVLVENDEANPLNASWFLYYLHGRGRILQNLTFLRGDDLRESEVYLITRSGRRAELEEYGSADLMAQSVETRGEKSSEDRWSLFRLRFRDGLRRLPAHVRITPAQAAGLDAGPFLQ